MLIADRLRDPFGEARAFVERGRACEQKAPAEAIGWYDRALSMLAEWNETVVDVIRWKGTAHRECGDTAEADRLYEQSAEIAREIGYRGGEAHAANCRAIIAQRRGSLAKAEQVYQEASDLAQLAGDVRLRAMVEHNLGVLAATRGAPEQALAHYHESLRASDSLDDADGVSRNFNSMARLYVEQGRNQDAEPLLERVVHMARRRHDTVLECTALINLAEVRLHLGRVELAEVACVAAMCIAEDRGDRLRRAEVLRVIAEIWGSRGEKGRAADALDEALLLANDCEDLLLAAEIWRAQARLGRFSEEPHWVRVALNNARSMFAEAGADSHVAHIEAAIARLAD